MKNWGATIILLLWGITIIAQENGMEYILLESNLPIISIRTHNQEIPDEPKITASMAIIANDSSHINTLTTSFNKYELQIGIEMRGESSQYFYPKKSYGIETRDSLGENLNIPLLGLPKENDWILYAPYGDKTMLRNAIVYDAARKMMDWAPHLIFCELVINNAYQGVYLFGEKIKRDKNRVDIAKLVEKDTAGNDLTGGYIIKIDKGERNDFTGWDSPYSPTPTSHQEIFFQYHYPKPENILPVQSAYIQDHIESFEASLMGENFSDPDLGYQAYIDVDTFVDYFILNELSRNVDGYRLSTFLYKDKDSNDGRIKMGPVWDYNLGFGNADYCLAYNHVGWAYKLNTTCPNGYWSIPFWWERLMEDRHFKNLLKTRWVELREGPLQTDTLINFINDQVTYLGDAIPRNFEKWPILGRWVWPNYTVKNTYSEEVDELIRWISYRVKWLDAYMPGSQINTGIEESYITDLELEVYPNPFTDVFTINAPVQPPEQMLLQVYSATGQKIIDNTIQSYPYQVSLTGQTSGFYYFRLITKKGNLLHQGKLMKQE
ncbi:MAG: CotH kinase family protein [Bacteroidota bacterium]|nr:CotH kinase family protein [Bacteroidota bacterium]